MHAHHDEHGPASPVRVPDNVVGALAKGVLSEREARHVRCNYGAKLSMIDHWLGRLLDTLDALAAVDAPAEQYQRLGLD